MTNYIQLEKDVRVLLKEKISLADMERLEASVGSLQIETNLIKIPSLRAFYVCVTEQIEEKDAKSDKYSIVAKTDVEINDYLLNAVNPTAFFDNAEAVAEHFVLLRTGKKYGSPSGKKI